MPDFIQTPGGLLEVARAADANTGFTTAPTLQELTRLYPPKTNVGREATVGIAGGTFTNYRCNGTAWVVDAGGSGGGSTVTVVNSLTSTSATAALAAAQGKALKDLIDALPDPSGLVVISFANELPYTVPEASFGTLAVTSDRTITPNPSGAVQFNSVIGVFVGDGTHIVTAGAGYVALDSNLGFDPTKRNTFASYYDGAQFLYQFLH